MIINVFAWNWKSRERQKRICPGIWRKIRILSVCLNEILFVFIRTKKELCYGSSIDVLNHNIYQATDVYLECQDDKISEVIEAYKEFYQTLPEDLDKGVFDRQKEKLEVINKFQDDIAKYFFNTITKKQGLN